MQEIIYRKKGNKNDSTSSVNIDLYIYTKDLWNELEKDNYISRLKTVPQLGAYKVKKSQFRSRYDYIILQLYLHRIIKEKVKDLPDSFSQKIPFNELDIDEKSNQFSTTIKDALKINNFTVGDAIQMMTIITNIGHFHNTFVSSRASLMYADKNENYRSMLEGLCKDSRFSEMIKIILQERDYIRYQFVNALVILEKCNSENVSVQLAKELIYSYYFKDKTNNKLKDVFISFQQIRNVAMIGYDLQVSPVPLVMDFREKELKCLFDELLKQYNDSTTAKTILESSAKLIASTTYNETVNAICLYNVSKQIYKKLSKLEHIEYWNLLMDPQSIFNTQYGQSKNFYLDEILKITFTENEKSVLSDFVKKLNCMNNIVVGHYIRYNGDQTILVSIKKGCKNRKKVAFSILRLCVTTFNKLQNSNQFADTKRNYLLASKFYLYYLMGERKIELKNTIGSNSCVICSRGSKKRIEDIEAILKTASGEKTLNDEKHEIEFLKNSLAKDKKDDISLSIPCSIKVYEDNRESKAEFDGMVIFPNRKKNQLLFLEAKNTRKSNQAKGKLSKRLNDLCIDFSENEIVEDNRDAYLYTNAY